MNLILGLLFFMAGLALISWGAVQAAALYGFRSWFDRQLAGEVARLGREEVEQVIGKIKSGFIRQHILQRLKTYGGHLLVSFVRGEITKYARIGLLAAAAGLLLCFAAFNAAGFMAWFSSI